MSVDYSAVLVTNYPGTLWTLNGDEYDGLTWLSDTPKPTKDELDALWQDTLDMIAAEKQTVEDKKASALAKLAAIGLTEDEAKLLFGI
jgi:hypothetical protein